MGGVRGAYGRGFVWITEDKTTFEKPRPKWEDIFKIICKGWDRSMWTGLIWLRV